MDELRTTRSLAFGDRGIARSPHPTGGRKEARPGREPQDVASKTRKYVLYTRA
jgi:hypothetical protein